jgi:hypothetical protein
MVTPTFYYFVVRYFLNKTNQDISLCLCLQIFVVYTYCTILQGELLNQSRNALFRFIDYYQIIVQKSCPDWFLHSFMELSYASHVTFFFNFLNFISLICFLIEFLLFRLMKYFSISYNSALSLKFFLFLLLNFLLETYFPKNSLYMKDFKLYLSPNYSIHIISHNIMYLFLSQNISCFLFNLSIFVYRLG